MKSDLENLLKGNRLIWRGREVERVSQVAFPTGYTGLDALLPGGGWLPGTLIEVIASQWGIGELLLFLPVMLAASQEKKQLVWIAPPYIPYAPALVAQGISLDHLLIIHPPHHKDIPWAMEKVLRQPRCAIVLTWSSRLAPKMLRRLQLAAEEGGSLGVLFQTENLQSSFAATRLLLKPSAGGVEVTILKSRAVYGDQSITLSFS